MTTYKPSIESIILLVICMSDMLSTLYFVSVGQAVEQNPLMQACIEQGMWAFVLVKLISFVPFIIITEWYRRKKPRFALNMTRCAIGLYLTSYAVFTCAVNTA